MYKRQPVFLLSTFDFCCPSPLHLRLHLDRMSWDSYVAKLTANPSIEDAAICGRDTGSESVWAASCGFQGITAAEIIKLAGDANAMRQSGPCLAGQKCMLLRDNTTDENLYSMDLKTSRDANGKTYSVCVGVTNKALVIAKGKEGVHGGALAPAVFEIVKYLRGQNY